MSLGQDWMNEISLDPAKPWLQMGTRQLGSRPWLVADHKRLSELSLKHRLLADIPGDVLIGAGSGDEQGSEAEQETLELVTETLARDAQPADLQQVQDELISSGHIQLDSRVEPTELSALDIAARLVQEDLCLLQRTAEGWLLQAASLCFPSRWSLVKKIGRPMGEVHGPVPGYDSTLQARVDNLLDRLGEQIVWRRNWFIHPDPSLHQPTRPINGDPTVNRDRCLDDLFLRSERQTLRQLSRSGWCLFTIRTQQAPLSEFLLDERIGPFRHFLRHSASTDLNHRGMSDDQVVELQAAVL